MYDCIIIGAGPAGLMAARAISRQTGNFLVLDGKNTIGLPLRCGEAVRQSDFTDLFGTTDYPFVENTAGYQEVRCGSVRRRFQFDFLELNRPGFEQWLAAQVKDRISLKTSCNNVTIGKDYAEVVTKSKTLKAQCVIVASGCDYALQKKLGLINARPRLVIGYGGIFEYKGLEQNTFYYFFDYRYNGYVWLFPKSKNLANIGFGALNVKNPREVLRRLLDSLGIKARQKSEYSGLINISGPIERTYSSRLLVAGTAAGLVFAGTGEGIRYALLSGKMAGDTFGKALQKDDFSETQMASYEHEWKQLFGDAMQGGIVFRDLLFLGFKMKALELLFQQPSEEELRQMILAGKVPKRAALAWKTMDTLGRFRHRNPQQSKDF